MLKNLSISNYVLIDKLNIDFHANFSAITGETGAGKSIIIGGLGLILGKRADTATLLDPEKKCIIEGAFDISAFDLKRFFEKKFTIPFVSAFRSVIVVTPPKELVSKSFLRFLGRFVIFLGAFRQNQTGSEILTEKN